MMKQACTEITSISRVHRLPRAMLQMHFVRFPLTSPDQLARFWASWAGLQRVFLKVLSMISLISNVLAKMNPRSGSNI